MSSDTGFLTFPLCCHFLTVIIKEPYYLVYLRAHFQLMTGPPADPLTLIRATKRQITAVGQYDGEVA